MMKRYIAFAHDHYYPCGGMSDLVGFFDDKTEAQFAALGDKSDTAEVFDTEREVLIRYNTDKGWEELDRKEWDFRYRLKQQYG